MALTKYPITDYNNLNVDWMIEKIQENADNIDLNAAGLTAEASARQTADAELLQLIQQIEPFAPITKYPFTPQEFGAKADGVTDDTQSIQDCIDAAHADGRAVYFPGGVYAVGTVLHDIGTGRECALKCYDGDTLFGDGTAVLRRTSTAVQRMLHTYGASDAGAYNAIHRLNIYGLNFDNNRDLNANQGTLGFMACHGENVHIRNCSFTGCNGWHCIELNSLRFSSVENCYFSNSENTSTSTGCEHIQIDAALANTGVWGLEDGTVCHDILISGNIHQCGTGVAVGNHTGAAHYGIVVDNCVFSDYTGTRATVSFVSQMKESVVNGCRFSNCIQGVSSNNATVQVTNCQFVNVTTPLVGELNAHNCITDTGFVTIKNAISNGNATDVMTDLSVWECDKRLANAYWSNLPISSAGVLETNKSSGSGNYGTQTFFCNNGLYYRLYNSASFGNWLKFLGVDLTEMTDVNAEFTALRIGDMSIKFGGSSTSNRPSGAGAGLCVTIRNTGSGNFGTQFYLSNDGLFARKYTTSGWGSWVTISKL